MNRPSSKARAPAKLPDLTPRIDYDIDVIKYSAKKTLAEYMRLQRRMALTSPESSDSEQAQETVRKRDAESLKAQRQAVLQDLDPLRSEIAKFRTTLSRSRRRHWVTAGSAGLGIRFLFTLPKLFAGKTQSSYTSPASSARSVSASALVAQMVACVPEMSLRTRVVVRAVLYFLAVMYVVQNELSIKAARTVQGDLERLRAKVDEGRDVITEEDIETLRGWNWRVLFWE